LRDLFASSFECRHIYLDLHAVPVMIFDIFSVTFLLNQFIFCSHMYTPCPKISSPLLQTHLIQFVVHGFQQNIVHCTILTLVKIIPITTYALYRVCSV